MRITDLFSEPVQSTVRNALEAATLGQAIMHAYLSRRRSRKEGTCEGRRDAVAAASRRDGTSAPSDTHVPLPSAVTRDPVPARHRVIDPANPKRDIADTGCRDHRG
jgi:hypothetical protein